MFKKYTSIENSYRVEFIKQFTDIMDLDTVEFVILEKLHGANIQFIITENSIQTASRNQIVEDNFNNYQNIISRPVYKEFFDSVKKWIKEYGITGINLYGELFGNGVQKGIDYGEQKQILFFDLRIFDSEYKPYADFKQFVPEKLRVPELSIVKGLEESLLYPEKFITNINPTESNFAEGIVIKPFRQEIYSLKGNRLILKKKGDAFIERKSKPRKRLENKVYLPDRVSALQHFFREYLVPQRLDNVESREGKILDRKNIAKYRGLVIQDAIGDFMKDYGKEAQIWFDKDKRYKKVIFSADQSLIALLINRVDENNG